MIGYWRRLRGPRENVFMRQLELFTTSELAALRDRTKSRNYSASKEQFRRDHARRRDWGLARRHAHAPGGPGSHPSITTGRTRTSPGRRAKKHPFMHHQKTSTTGNKSFWPAINTARGPPDENGTTPDGKARKGPATISHRHLRAFAVRLEYRSRCPTPWRVWNADGVPADRPRWQEPCPRQAVMTTDGPRWQRAPRLDGRPLKIMQG
jgi:hypothetical protein